MDIEAEIDSNTVIVENFITPLTSMDRSSRQKINKDRSLKWHTRLGGFNQYLQSISPQISKIEYEREVTTDTKEIWRIVRQYYKQVCANKLDKLQQGINS